MSTDDDDLPDEVNWVEKGAVTPVRSQQIGAGGNINPCGSCWAHAVIESIESAYYIKHGELLTFSVQ